MQIPYQRRAASEISLLIILLHLPEWVWKFDIFTFFGSFSIKKSTVIYSEILSVTVLEIKFAIPLRICLVIKKEISS